MSRIRKFLHGVGSGYFLLALNAFYTLASVPLVLSHLSRDEFGVWIIIGQMAGYLTMIDLGTTGAGTRLLIDHKDAPQLGSYGGLIKALALTQLVQAAIILVVGLSVAGLLVRVLRIDAALAGAFHLLWLWQVVFLAASFVCKVAMQLLVAHQRMDIYNYAQAAGIVLNFTLLWLALANGFELYSFVIAQGAATALTLLWTLAAAWKLKLVPPAGAWGRVTGQQFRRLFGFGAEMFLVALGTQFINSSQSLVITRLVGLDVAAVWSVMTKAFMLLSQLVWRMVAAAMPALSEMLVRGEQERLWHRYRNLFQVVLLLSAYFGVMIAVANTPFVHLWTSGRIDWARVNDALVGIWLVLLTVVCCHNSLILNTKAVGFLKYIYFVEGAAFIALCFLVVPTWGMTGMLLCSIASTIVFTFAYGLRRIASIANLPLTVVAGQWMKPFAGLAALMIPVAFLMMYLTRSLSDLGQLLAGGLPVAVIGAVALYRLCPSDLLAEMLARMPRPLQKLAAARRAGF